MQKTWRGCSTRFRLSLLQFHGTENGAFCQFNLACPISRPSAWTPVRLYCRLNRNLHDAAGLLLDSHEPGAWAVPGRSFDWARIEHHNLPVILAGGLTR